MIRAIYLNGYTNDISPCMDIRNRVYQEEYGISETADEKDRDAVHILLFDQDDRPMGTVRLLFGMDEAFEFGYLSILPSYRNQGNADFIMHLVFDKAALSGAKVLYFTEAGHQEDYFKRYGFVKAGNRQVLDLKQYYKGHSCHHEMPTA